MKLITAFAGLEEGLVTPETTVECRSYHKSGGEALICSKEGGHGQVDLEHALAHSCNVYFYKLGERLGAERLAKYSKLFGLRPTIGKSSIARAAIGEADGLKVSPMRMAVIMAAIANGGTEYSPEVGTSGKPTVLRKIPARQGTYPLLRRGMRMAVVEGTARNALVPGLNVCGKTGSPAADNQPEYRHAWFIGFAPYDRPNIAIVVFCEWGHGADQAAPIARQVFKAYHDGATRRWGDRGK
jgi:penicillin-binding protein 2